jgi:acid stress-induced BolA-like protein IbaG/YrbA
MENIRTKIEKILIKSGFSKDELNLEDVNVNKVAGFVVSEKFADMPDMERQDYIWSIFDEKLAVEDRLKIVAIITLSPDEVEAYAD